MTEDPLRTLSDLVSDAHAQIQAAHEHINPVVEVGIIGVRVKFLGRGEVA